MLVAGRLLVAAMTLKHDGSKSTEYRRLITNPK